MLKRFKPTSSGMLKASQAGKVWYDKALKKFIRNARGTTTLSKADEGIVKTYMPYANKDNKCHE